MKQATKHLRLFVVILLLSFLSAPASGTRELDKQYRFRKFLPLVTNLHLHPVYGKKLESELLHYLRTRPSIAPVTALLPQAKKEHLAIKRPLIKKATPKDLVPFLPLFAKFKDKEADAIIFAEIQWRQDSYDIFLALVNIKQAELIKATRLQVANRFRLESFKEAAFRAMDKLMQAIPFDATILKRAGQRVILDKGAPELQVGMELPAYTIQNFSGESTLVETGNIILTQIGKKISFGKIIREHPPLRVSTDNKVRVPDHPRYTAPTYFGVINPQGRYLASTSQASAANLANEFGYVDLDFGAALVSLNQKTRQGTGVSEKTVYPSANLNVELWMTQRIFFDFGFQISSNSALASEQNSNISHLHGNVGYRLPFAPKDKMMPIAHIKAGFSKASFNTDPSNSTNAFVSTTYSGLSLGAGMTIPIKLTWGLGFEVSGLLFGSASESPVDSGEVTRATGWTFSARGYYRLRENIDLEAKLRFQSNNAEFSGLGTRPLPVVASSQNTSSMLLGLTYYF